MVFFSGLALSAGVAVFRWVGSFCSLSLSTGAGRLTSTLPDSAGRASVWEVLQSLLLSSFDGLLFALPVFFLLGSLQHLGSFCCPLVAGCSLAGSSLAVSVFPGVK